MSINSQLIENQESINSGCKTRVEAFIENVYPTLDKVYKIYAVHEMEKMAKKSYLSDLAPIRKFYQLMMDHCQNLLLPLIHCRDGSICMICSDKTKNLHIDHIIPKSKFPSSHPWNLQSLCANCNIEKSNEILDQIPIMLKGAKHRSKILFSTLKSSNINFFVSTQESFIVSLDVYYGLRLGQLIKALDQKRAEQFIDSVIFENVEWKKTLSMLTELLESVKKNGY